MLIFASLLIAVVLAGYGALHYMTSVPGVSHRGALPPLTAEETALAARLKAHVEIVAAREHNLDTYEALEEAARHIEAALAETGLPVARQEFSVRGKRVRNIEAVAEPAAAVADPDVIVVGAHYDSMLGSPGANDNATGTAAVLELARAFASLHGTGRTRLHFALFVNEEPPYFKTADMGSYRYARALAERGERVVAMYCLETLGFYSDAPGSQRYPPPFDLLYPDRADFVAFVGLLGARPLVREAIGSFRSHTAFPSIGGVAPGIIPGIDWSDHWSFAQFGFPAVMITDTALFRYPHYHALSDTPDKVDYARLARVTTGIARVIRAKLR